MTDNEGCLGLAVCIMLGLAFIFAFALIERGWREGEQAECVARGGHVTEVRSSRDYYAWICEGAP